METEITGKMKIVKGMEDTDLHQIFEFVYKKFSQNDVLEPPSEIIIPRLSLHQKQDLFWLHQREKCDDMPPFWVQQDQVYINTMTNYKCERRPDPLRGGIFADETGFGKALMLISLITLDNCTISNDGSTQLETSTMGMRQPETTKMTLILCPHFVVSTWKKQLSQHVKHGQLKYFIYNGGTSFKTLM
ncbi:hypothetical protein R6Q57_009973 [Mikania cordata]